MLSAFKDNLLADSIHVYPPSRNILLCGGEVSSIIEKSPKSLRDAFIRADGFSIIKNTEIIQIEEIREYFEKDSPYLDLVDFERDIAQVCELVILFSESPGSFAELGSFSNFDEIMEKLLVIVRAKFLLKSSYISKGPVASLRRRFSNSVFTIVDTALGIVGDNVDNINAKALVENLKSPISVRIKEAESRTTLDKSKFNHLCKIYVALLQEFYALKDEEILDLFTFIGFEGCDQSLLNRVAFCCAAVRWAATTTSGFDRVHYAIRGNEAAKFAFSAPLEDKLRRRVEFRNHWQSIDGNRMAAADEALKQ